MEDFSGGSVVKNPPASAWDRFYPRSGKILHTVGHLRPCATTAEAGTPTAHAPQQEKPPQWEVHASQLESSPRAPQLEKACT